MAQSRDEALEEAKKHREQILQKLVEEGEDELEMLLAKCGQPLALLCTNCGHRHMVETKCRQKWCPVCVRAIATKRSMKYAAAAVRMEWPLFITLTVKNILDLGEVDPVRFLRRSFGKLRHRKIWKDNVSGGIAAIEVTNKGNGWHPHLHALVDCRWLAVKTPRPQRGESRESVKRKLRAAKREFTALWCKVIKQKHGICWIQRADGETCAREVLKYSIKGSDLAESPDPIGPMIHCLRATRLVTSFGTLFGKLRIQEEPNPGLTCDRCGQLAEWMPEQAADLITTQRRKK